MPPSLGRKISIVGGTGKMGQWLAKFFKEQGFNVVISGRDVNKSQKVAAKLNISFAGTSQECVKNSDLIIVATPIEVVPRTIREIAGGIKRGAILFDIASVKEIVADSLKMVSRLGINVLSIHPMFGPGAKSIKGKSILIIPIIKNPRTIKTVSNFFRKAGANVFMVKNAEEHDKMIALTLALPHFLNIIFSSTLRLAEPSIQYVKKFSGTTFALQLLLAESVLQEDPTSYATIQFHNKHFKHILENLTTQTDSFKNLMLSKNYDEFVKRFNSARDYLSADPQFKKAYKKFYGAFESVT